MSQVHAPITYINNVKATPEDYSEFDDENRPPTTVFKEAVHALAFFATKAHYIQQPSLWKMQEWGRARTLEDYTHHFVALSALEKSCWKTHLDWCERFWDARKYPHEWLNDGWAIMREVINDVLPTPVARKAIEILDMTPELTSWK